MTDKKQSGENDKRSKQQTQGNLGQKEAQQQKRHKDELAHMGELSKSGNKKKQQQS